MPDDDNGSEESFSERWKRRGRRIERTPYAAYERATSVGKGISRFGLASVLWVFMWIAVIVVILLIIAAIIFGFRAAQTGVLDDFLTRISFGVQATPVGEVAQKEGATLVDLIFNPDEYFRKTYGSGFSTTEEKEEEKFGVFVSRFYSIRGLYRTDDIIRMIAEVEIKSPPEEDTQVSFRCELDDTEDKGKIELPASGLDKLADNIVVIPADTTKNLRVKCIFEEWEDNKEYLRKVNFKTNYNTFVKALWEVNFIQEAFFDRDKTKKTKSTFTPGPVTASLGTFDDQPFISGETYSFGGNIKNKLASDGHIKKLESLQVKVPLFVELETDDKSCSFTSVGSDGKQNVYSFKQEEISRVNDIDCIAEFLIKIPKLTVDDCLDKFKDNIPFDCDFKSGSSASGSDFFELNAGYVYSMKELKLINVLQAPEPTDEDKKENKTKPTSITVEPDSDEDGDGILNKADNCINVANPTQLDADNDGYGNQCDCDLNNEGTCGFSDFNIFLDCFGKDVPISDGPADDPNCQESDMDGNGVVGDPDFTLFNKLVGTFPGPGCIDISGGCSTS